MEHAITVDKAALSVHNAASTDKARPNLAVVRMENGCAVATNGKVLVCAELPSQKTTSDAPVTISSADAYKMAKQLPKRNGEAALTVVDGKVTARVGNTITALDPDDCGYSFPDYYQVIPQGEPVISIGYSIEQLERIIAIAKAHETKALRFDVMGNSESTPSPTRISPASLIGPYSAVRPFVAILMPVKLN